MQYLTIEQVLSDFVAVANHFRDQRQSCDESPVQVIAIGGSYGGMLATWLRQRYPSTFSGAWAASAPVRLFDGLSDPSRFYEIVSNTYSTARAGCGEAFRTDLFALHKMLSVSSQWKDVQATLKLCQPVQTEADAAQVFFYVKYAIITMAMVDYPYSTGFMSPLPAWPVNSTCAAIDTHIAAANPLPAISAALKTFYSRSSPICYNISVPSAQPCSNPSGCRSLSAWDYQCCTQMTFPLSSNGETDFFPAMPFNITAVTEGCQQRYV